MRGGAFQEFSTEPMSNRYPELADRLLTEFGGTHEFIHTVFECLSQVFSEG